MANLTSTAPAAFDAFYALLVTAGAAQSTPVSVLDTIVAQYEPGTYVILKGFDRGPESEIAALGSYAFYETYELCGEATIVQGFEDSSTGAKLVRDATFALFQNVVMTTVVANRGQPPGTPVLGSGAPAGLEWIVPTRYPYTATAGDFGGGQAGIQGTIEFAFMVKARITTA